MSAPRCDGCCWWREIAAPGWQGLGRCHRLPPHIVDMNHLGEWPTTYHDEFCGEFRAAENECGDESIREG